MVHWQLGFLFNLDSTYLKIWLADYRFPGRLINFTIPNLRYLVNKKFEKSKETIFWQTS